MARWLISTTLFALLWVPAASAQLQFDERVANLGEVFQFQDVEHVFGFVNRSAEAVTIKETEAILRTGSVTAVPEQVAPGERGEIRVRQPVGDRLGQTAFRFAVRTDDGATPEIKLLLEGFVHSAYWPEAGRVVFGDVLRQQGAVREFVLTSREADDLGSIAVAQGPEFVEIRELGPTAGGQGRRLSVRLTPEVPLGFVAGKIELRTGVAAQSSYLLEYRATVYGDIVPSENPANLGLLRIGEPMTKEIVFRAQNGGEVELERIEPATVRGLQTKVSECPGEESCQRLELTWEPPQVGELRGTLDLYFAGQQEPMPLTYSGIVASKTAVVHDIGALTDQPIRIEGRKHLKPSAKLPKKPPESSAPPGPAPTVPTPTAAPADAPAESAEASARLAWSVRKQDHIFGYFVYRSLDPEGPFRRVSDEMVKALPGPGNVGRYEFVDREVEAGQTYYYFIDLVTRSGLKERLSGVLSKTVGG
ncbi:MAG: DUF1573 domain-containing protein [Acidobacteriota bacterium]